MLSYKSCLVLFLNFCVFGFSEREKKKKRHRERVKSSILQDEACLDLEKASSFKRKLFEWSHILQLQSFHISLSLSLHLFLSFCISLSLCLSLCISLSLCVSLSVCLSLSLSLSLSLWRCGGDDTNSHWLRQTPLVKTNPIQPEHPLP